MTLPTFIDFLNLVEGDIEVLQFWQLKGGEFVKFIVGEVEIFQVEEGFFITKDRNVLDFILSKVQVNQIL